MQLLSAREARGEALPFLLQELYIVVSVLEGLQYLDLVAGLGALDRARRGVRLLFIGIVPYVSSSTSVSTGNGI